MGLFDSTSSQNTSGTQNETVAKTDLKNSTQATTNQTGSKGMQTTVTLDPEVQRRLAATIEELGNNVGKDLTKGRETANSNLQTLQLLQQRAGQADAETNSIVDNAVEAAKLSFAEGQEAELNQFAQGVGSNMNTTVNLLKQKGQRDLATSLAALRSNLRMEGRDRATAEITGAANVGSQITADFTNLGQIGVGGMTAVGNTLKGATQATQTEATQTDNTVSKESDALLQLIANRGDMESTTTGKQSDSIFGQGISLIKALSGFAG